MRLASPIWTTRRYNGCWAPIERVRQHGRAPRHSAPQIGATHHPSPCLAGRSREVTARLRRRRCAAMGRGTVASPDAAPGGSTTPPTARRPSGLPTLPTLPALPRALVAGWLRMAYFLPRANHLPNARLHTHAPTTSRRTAATWQGRAPRACNCAGARQSNAARTPRRGHGPGTPSASNFDSVQNRRMWAGAAHGLHPIGRRLHGPCKRVRFAPTAPGHSRK